MFELLKQDIKVGDKVIFNSTSIQSNHDLFWKVIDKNEKNKQIIIQLNEMGFKDVRWVISAEEIIMHNSLSNK